MGTSLGVFFNPSFRWKRVSAALCGILGVGIAPVVQNVCHIQMGRAFASLCAWKLMPTLNVPAGTDGYRRKGFPTEPSVVATAILGQGGDPSSLMR